MFYSQGITTKAISAELKDKSALMKEVDLKNFEYNLQKKMIQTTQKLLISRKVKAIKE
jgi:hypothetical protein